MTNWMRDKNWFNIESEVTAAMIEWLLEVVPSDLISTHKHPITEYLNVPLEDIYNTLVARFRIDPEDFQDIEKRLRAPWDHTSGMMCLYTRVQELLQEKAEMNGQQTYTNAEF